LQILFIAVVPLLTRRHFGDEPNDTGWHDGKDDDTEYNIGYFVCEIREEATRGLRRPLTVLRVFHRSPPLSVSSGTNTLMILLTRLSNAVLFYLFHLLMCNRLSCPVLDLFDDGQSGELVLGTFTPVSLKPHGCGAK